MARRPPRGFSSWSAYNAYRVRRGVERGLSPTQALGRPRAGEARASLVERRVTILGPNGSVQTTVVGVAALSRAGSYDNDAQELLAGRVDMATWDRRWAGRTIGDVVLPDAARVIRLQREGLASFEDFYPDRDAP
jgi:hypothetical protein